MKQYDTRTGVKLSFEESKYYPNANILDVYLLGREDRLPFFITDEMLQDSEYMAIVANDLNEGFVPLTDRRDELKLKSINSNPHKIADAEFEHSKVSYLMLGKLIDEHLQHYKTSDGEEITNVSYCPQTKTLTVKSITHKIIQL